MATVEDHVVFILGHGFSNTSFDYLRNLLDTQGTANTVGIAAVTEALSSAATATEVPPTASGPSPEQVRLQTLMAELEKAVAEAKGVQ